MRLIIAGSRNFPREKAYQLLSEWGALIERASLVLVGRAAGPDTYGEHVACLLRVPVEAHPALWAAEGRAAGIRRNERMVARADALLALWDGQSKGTEHIIQAANAAGLTVIVLGPDGARDLSANTSSA